MYYSQYEACKILGLAYTTTRRWIEKYHIEHRRSVAGKIRIGESGLEQLQTIKTMKQQRKIRERR